MLEKLHCLDLMKKYFIPDEKEQVAFLEGINMQICIDRLLFFIILGIHLWRMLLFTMFG
jgi:hypothetical protein